MKLYARTLSVLAYPLCIFILFWQGPRNQRQVEEGALHREDLLITQNRVEPSEEASDDDASKAIRQFVSLPPNERVAAWKKGGYGKATETAIYDALVILGVDTVPYFSELVKEGGRYYSVGALELLCNMDRFVPVNELLLPEVGGTNGVRHRGISGRLNLFMKVDGRRIGKLGYETVMWAAEQTKHKHLRFHARSCSGLLEDDLRKLTLEEQIKQWRDTVARSKGILASVRDSDAYIMIRRLSDLLAESAPASIPVLIDMLEKDPSSYVREEALRLLHLIDSCRMRLRASELGRRAIEAIKRAFEVGKLKPFYDKKDVRENKWKRLSAEFFNDDVYLSHGTKWSVIANAFEKFYGAKVTKRVFTVTELIEAVPEFRQFVTYLTEVDPNFPGWEYTYIGLLNADEVLHPRFKEKVARYYEQWVKFKARQDKESR